MSGGTGRLKSPFVSFTEKELLPAAVALGCMSSTCATSRTASDTIESGSDMAAARTRSAAAVERAVSTSTVASSASVACRRPQPERSRMAPMGTRKTCENANRKRSVSKAWLRIFTKTTTVVLDWYVLAHTRKLGDEPSNTQRCPTSAKHGVVAASSSLAHSMSPMQRSTHVGLNFRHRKP